MPRHGKRSNDFDDSLERSYILSKRPKTDNSVTDTAAASKNNKNNKDETMSSKSNGAQKRQQKLQDTQLLSSNDKKTENQTIGNKSSSTDNESSRMERQRQKKQQRKEQNKLKAQERQRQKEQQAEAQRKQQQQALKKKKQLELQKKLEKQQQQKKPDGTLITAHKGVQYQDIILGTGPEIKMGKQIQVQYTLRAAPGRNGRVIDSSRNFGTKLGRGEVIEGWDIGLKGMKRGGLRHLIVPPQAGYGKHKNIGAGKGALLYFEIKLLAC